jgi:hypothetical protein
MADQVLRNQEMIVANQTKILANQEKILANQSKILTNQEEALPNREKNLAKNLECPSDQGRTGGVRLTHPEPAGVPWHRSGV